MNAIKAFIFWLYVSTLCTMASGAELVTDESTRLKILAAVFPGMAITATPTRHIDGSGHSTMGPAKFEITDPLGSETVYRISGPLRTQNERCAGEDVASGKQSHVREARSRIYKIAGAQFVAISQYDFPGVGPAGACWSIARISLVQEHDGVFTDSSDFEPNTSHHGGLDRAEFESLSPGASEQLLVESDVGGGGGYELNFLVFEFVNGKVVPLLDTPSVLSNWGLTVSFFVQSLDLDRTRAAHGSRFCFTKTTYIEDDKHFVPPRITRPCYRRGEGIEIP
jgi:hypothetical protein